MNERNRNLCDDVGDIDSLYSFNLESDKQKLRAPSNPHHGAPSASIRVSEKDEPPEDRNINIIYPSVATTTTPSLERDSAADSPDSKDSQKGHAEVTKVTTPETSVPTVNTHVPILPPLVRVGDVSERCTQDYDRTLMDQSQQREIADTPRVQTSTTGKTVDDQNSDLANSHCHFAPPNTTNTMIAAQSLQIPHPRSPASPTVPSYIRQEANTAQEYMQNRQQRQYWQPWAIPSTGEHPQNPFAPTEEYSQRSHPQNISSPSAARISPRRTHPPFAHSHSVPLSSSPVSSGPRGDIQFMSRHRSSSFGGDNKYDGTQSSPVSSTTTHFSVLTQTGMMAGHVQPSGHLRHPPPATHVYFPIDRASSPGVGLAAHGTPPGPHMMPSSPRGGPRSAPIHNHGPRTPPEVLKTLLRKKACLYEAGTSYAIALVTWLVGRSLTIQTGYFSRQELQYGVHQVVSDIIDSGNITRTKVNRCMQIILNSCFHYIIPHPNDDESSKRFRERFAVRSTNDSHLLHSLEPPWENLDVDGAMKTMLEGDNDSDIEEEEEEQGEEKSKGEGSPKLTFRRRVTAAAALEANEGTPAASRESEQADSDGEGGSVKRAVLLCFNEYVTSFEDVWRCHNEFIRDVARLGNLKLTALEWKEFFTRESPGPATPGRGAPSVDSSSEEGSRTSLSPRLRPRRSPARREIGPPIPEFSLDGQRQLSYAAAAAHFVGDTHTEIDHRFGVMDENELSKFRTSWCTKRYDHDPRVCTFAHAQVNQGWLRRNPKTYHYNDEFCPNILKVRPNPRRLLEGCSFNRCPNGVFCEFCHSQEEMEYHPDRYKRQVKCPMLAKDGDLFDNCDRDHTCPYLHPIKHHDGRLHRRSDSGGSRYGSQHRSQQHPRSPRMQGKSHSSDFSHLGETPAGSRMMYIHPAPESSFERSLALPGLMSLFRQHSSVLYSHMTTDPSQEMICAYRYFPEQEIPSSSPQGDKEAHLKASDD